METAAPGPRFIPRPQVKAPGRKRGRPPIRRLEFQGYYVEPLLPHKALKKRGRKTALKMQPRLVPDPRANTSPNNNTTEPEMGFVPQDAAIVPHSTTSRVLAVNSEQHTGRPEVMRCTSEDPSNWGVEEVVWFIKDADPQALGPHAEVFRKHEIDGDALLLLKSEMMMKYLGLKLGPALKLCHHIDRLKQKYL